MAEIICPECAARYEVSSEALAGGRKVRCTACRTLWLARAQDETPPVDSDMAVPGPDDGPVNPPLAFDAPPVPARPRGAPVRPWHQRIRTGRERPARRTPVLAALAVVAIAGGLAAFRSTVVAHLPEAGPVYAALGLPVNLTGLELKAVKSGIMTEDGVEMLVVQGEIANVSTTARTVPRLKFAVLDARGVPLYGWTAQTDVKKLQPGERQTFRRRLASPPLEGRDVLVRFASKADLVAAAQ